MSKAEKSRSWAARFAALAALAAIVLLLSRDGQSMVEYGSKDWQVLRVYEGLSCWAVPALFMVWGMHALEAGKPSLENTIRGLVLPCISKILFWGAMYAVVSRLLDGSGWEPGGAWEGLESAAHGTTYFHLWVLYPLLGLYLLQPVIHRFTATASQREVGYILLLCFLFSSVLPVWEELHANGVLVKLLQRLRIHMVLGYLGYYMAGWYLYRYRISKLAEWCLYMLGAAGLVLTLMGDELLGGGQDLWYSYTAPGVALTAAALCAACRYVLRDGKKHVIPLSVAVGGYLFHQIWVLILRCFGYQTLWWPGVTALPLFGVGLYLLSVPFVWLLYRIPGAGKWLI